jgi:prepilin-type N-terminal cleavage/methylation domain-containing protein
MRKNLHINGFTLAELIVVMVLLTILASSSYMAYRYVYQSFINYNTASKDVSEVYRCLELAENEAWQADSVIYRNDSIVFITGGNRLSCLYPVKDRYVFNKGIYSDTLAIRKIALGTFITENGSQLLSTELSLIISPEGEEMEFKISLFPGQKSR